MLGFPEAKFDANDAAFPTSPRLNPVPAIGVLPKPPARLELEVRAFTAPSKFP
jgi:hypothetical protein